MTTELTEAAVDEALDGFRAWLEAKRPRQIVGRAWSGDACPIATYLGETWPGLIVIAMGAVLPHSYADGVIPDAIAELPGPLVDFTLLVDDLHCYARVTAKRALAYLDRCEA